jgi:hypothetical protein
MSVQNADRLFVIDRIASGAAKQELAGNLIEVIE